MSPTQVLVRQGQVICIFFCRGFPVASFHGGVTHIAIVFLLLISFGVVAIVVTTLMFALKKQNWSIALFLSAVFIGLLLTLISTVGRPANLQSRNSWVWLGLLPMVVGVALFFLVPRRRPLACILVGITIAAGLLSMFL